MRKLAIFSAAAMAVVAALLLFNAVQAEDEAGERGERGERSEHGEGMGAGYGFVPTNAKWKAECSACHVAYPANMLPADSWKALMGGLDKHFGTDASLDTASLTEISTFLQANASPERTDAATKSERGETAAKPAAPATPATQPVLRITETNWFKNTHEEVPSSVWKRPAVKSASNCIACHTQADQGLFGEDNVRIPK